MKRLPPFGRRLLDRRRQGDHPLEVVLVYGERWWPGKKYEALPRVAVRPSEYVPGTIDWRMLAGLHVIVVDRAEGLGEWVGVPERDCDDAWGRFYYLLGEISDYAARVTVVAEGATDTTPDALAYANRWRAPYAVVMQWPAWWSAKREQALQARFLPWMHDFAQARGFTLDGADGRAA